MPSPRRLGRTTGWTHRLTLQRCGVKMIGGAEYLAVDDAGLHVKIDGRAQCLEVDTVILCVGQVPRRDLYDDLCARGRTPHLIGGADVARDLDAKRAIRQATLLAAAI